MPTSMTATTSVQVWKEQQVKSCGKPVPVPHNVKQALSHAIRLEAYEQSLNKQSGAVADVDVSRDHPTYRLLSRSPVWTRLQDEEYNIAEEWTNQWQHSVVNNAYHTDDPSVPLPGLKNPALSQGEWVLINQLRSGHCRTAQTLHKWGKRKTLTCNHCGQQPQTIEHSLHKCPVTQFAGSLTQLHQLQDEEAIAWISRWSKAYEK